MAKVFCQFVILIISLNVFLLSERTYAEPREFSIFDIRKTLPLKKSEHIYKDYYINIGTDQGLKVGQYVKVYRRMPIIDIYRNKAQGDLIVNVAKMKVIHTQSMMAVARLVHMSDNKNIPVMTFDAVMLGDRVEIVTDSAENTPEPEKVVTKQPVKKQRQPAQALPQKEQKPVALPTVEIKQGTI